MALLVFVFLDFKVVIYHVPHDFEVANNDAELKLRFEVIEEEREAIKIALVQHPKPFVYCEEVWARHVADVD